MEQTWRWFGPDDVVRLSHARQAGATGIVTALHHIPYGVTWSVEDITARQAQIAADPSLGLRWSVVESLPVHESIKLGEGDLELLFENYRTPLAKSPDWLKAAPMWENLLASWRQSGQKRDHCPSLLNHNAKYKRLLPPCCDFANGVRPFLIQPADPSPADPFMRPRMYRNQIS